MSDTSQGRQWITDVAGADPDEAASIDINNLERVVTQYESSLLRYVTHLIGNCEDEAQDVVQEVFIKFIQQTDAHGQERIDNLQCWLFRVAHNLAMDFGRKRGRRRRLQEQAMSDPVIDMGGSRGPGGDVSDALARKEMTQLAMQELQQLPEIQKTVLLLKLIQGLTLREISDITGLKIGTVNYRLTQGLRTLGQQLKALGVMNESAGEFPDEM